MNIYKLIYEYFLRFVHLQSNIIQNRTLDFVKGYILIQRQGMGMSIDRIFDHDHHDKIAHQQISQVNTSKISTTMRQWPGTSTLYPNSLRKTKKWFLICAW